MAEGWIRIRGRELASARKKLRLTQREFGERIGLSEVRVRVIEKEDVAGVYPRTFRKVADALGMSTDELQLKLGVATPAARLTSDNLDLRTLHAAPEIPTFDLAVAAGNWVEVVQEGQVFDPCAIGHGRFRVHIDGDSMEPAYKHGILVEFRCLREGEDELEAGKDYYVQRADGTATFKRLEKISEDTLTLRALNKKKYKDPMPVARSEIVRMARAVAKVELV
jgi:transcriptional regulator with XRE-family HTH domain